jgi:DNA-binding CsgD family transcriptional regulator
VTTKRPSSTPPPVDVVAVVEAIYADALASSPRAWLPRVLERLRAFVPECVGSVAYAYEMAGPASSWQASYPFVDGGPSTLAEEVFQSFHHAPASFRQQLFGGMGAAGTYSQAMGTLLTEQHEYGARAAARLEMPDAVYLNSVDPDGRGVLFALNVAGRTRLSPTQRRRLCQVAAHVGAARRLVTRARSAPHLVFEPEGRVAHVEPGHEAALPSLRERLSLLQRMATRATRPDETLAAWEALVAGSYTLLTTFDADGRRHIVAHANAPGVRDPRGLTKLEAAVAGWAMRGHSQKLIGYELGLTVGTVGGVLARTFRKLRVRSRAELVQKLTPPESLAKFSLPEGDLLLFSALPARFASHDWGKLTPAERLVAQAAADGLSNEAIAAAHGKRAHTVTNQLSSVFRKLGIGSRAELVTRRTTGSVGAADVTPTGATQNTPPSDGPGVTEGGRTGTA